MAGYAYRVGQVPLKACKTFRSFQFFLISCKRADILRTFIILAKHFCSQTRFQLLNQSKYFSSKNEQGLVVLPDLVGF
ncbi:hypothetical protein BWI97_05390 [Siphonobacter sp. BAB-5405]|nr:hypothetical protein BWI97_05390 [Siphonobacter sp. BAB-5405]